MREFTAGQCGFDSRPGQNIALFYNVQTGLGVHPAPYPICTAYSFCGGKAAGREADYSPFSAEVKDGGSIPPLPHMSSWHVRN
jgi:hypothetical protein